MNTTDIRAIFFDLGNTLRILHKNPAHQAEGTRKLAELAGTDMTPEAFLEMINDRYEGYRKWCFRTEREATEEDLFTKWLLPEYPRERVLKNARDMAFQYRQTTGKREVAPNGRKTIETLHARGYRLGIISNLITSDEVPDWLEEAGFRQYFDPVLLSCVCGLRKPGVEIFHLAAKEAGLAEETIAFVGDNINRDIPGSKAAGYGMNVLYITPEKLSRHPMTDVNRPDAVIHRFIELLELFPGGGLVNEEFLTPENK
ncbi:HAD family hydrolase [Christensenellaceae bacterium OttesenSCG-928-L17]|nr:HAD family hydrolase [Christensenellaceae bacterium OttesenSCG-928-L17]